MRSKPDKIGAPNCGDGYKAVATNDHIFHPYERR